MIGLNGRITQLDYLHSDHEMKTKEREPKTMVMKRNEVLRKERLYWIH